MKVFRTLEEVQLNHSACALGMFDGVHLGHRMILENALRQARFHQTEGVIFSFANHPQSLTSQTPTQLLSSMEERLAYFEALGFDAALMLDFTPDLMHCSAWDFVRSILVDTLKAKSVTVGYDHRFGAKRQGDGAFLARCGRDYGFDTQLIDPVKVQDQIVSSTLIRKLLSYGDLDGANHLLGRPYAITASVGSGVQRGRAIGFPTANLKPEATRLLPAIGTYGGVGILHDEIYPAVCNVGLSPTFGDQLERRVEVHLLGYSGAPFYGESLTFQFVKKLREECRFASVQALIDQIQRDCDQVDPRWVEEARLTPLSPCV